MRKVCENGGSCGGVDGTTGLVGLEVRDRIEVDEGEIGMLRAAARAS